jgi:hypothetical protein
MLSYGCMIRLHAHHLTPSSSVNKLSLFLSLPCAVTVAVLTCEGGGRGGRGAKSYDREKALPTNHPLLSGNNLR